MTDLDKVRSNIGVLTKQNNDQLQPIFSTVGNFMTRYMPNRKWFIVGGLLRDVVMGLPFKDVDVFIVGTPEDALPVLSTDKGDRNAYLYMADEVTYKGIDINLIWMRGTDWTLETMTDRCDYGICQIGYCPEDNRIYWSDDFMCDINYETLTQCRDTVPSRQQRMQDKFPTHKLNNPSGFVLSSGSWRYDVETGQMARFT